ncbi:glycosyltransferase family 4 protein [Butyrivibrio sp. XBB1001]|uniref:glycosyltransferase family 4 protein n=1 Tax=Butyrivibrio sp. XBB1001 TaxID=1280682 RepID=UPI0003FD9806|nr:glycosyltransferase family 4 protein [Butyrivibrio sp. XBB1001]
MKIALYTNILSPYRKHFFDLLFDECRKRNIDFKVFVMAPTEPDRQWTYDEYKASYTELLEGRTLVIKHAYIHFNKNLISVIKDYNPDVMICSGSYLCPGIWTVAKKRKKLGYKCYFWSESHINQKRDNNKLVSLFLEYLRSNIYKKFDAFLYAGELSYDFIKKYAGDKAEGIFVPNLIDEKKFVKAQNKPQSEREAIREKYKLPLDKRLMIMPARLSKVKGIDAFLDILLKCPSKNNVHIAIAGEGELREELEKRIQKENLPVSLLGYKNEDEMIDLYAASDIFLLPSFSDPNPLSCIEALWCGLPLFISDKVGNCREVLENGINGYVFSYDNQAEAIDKLNIIISTNEEWINTASKRSMYKADLVYNSEKNVKRIIEELMNGK